MRTSILALGAVLALAGCAADGGKLTTGSLKAGDTKSTAERKTTERAKPTAAARQASPQPVDRKQYCDEIRRTWKPGDTPPSAEALEKRRADNAYCAG